MTDSFQRAAGRKVLSRASAQELGTVNHLLLDAQRPQITAVIIGKGKKAQLVEWAHLSGFGPDAVMVRDEAALRPPANDRERAAADGKLDLVGKRVLTEKGNGLGTVDDVSFDPDTGALTTVRIGDRETPADCVLGSGTYAIVVDASQDPAETV
jgi:sporulation protein YlmC with PRC-barrel domain